jgi:hypothetical protein
MKDFFTHVVCLISLVFLFGVSLCAQAPATGVPPFSSIGGGPFDALNLGNLNAHFSVPILHKAGRGIPFDYDLTYAATCKAAGYDCLTKEEWIKPRISLRVAYEVGAARQQTVRSPRTMYPHSQEWHQNREATVYLPA